MRRAGRIWRYRPAELSLQRRSKLNGHSHPVEHFDIFFSHTWLTPGRWKVLSLLLQRGCTFMLLAWCFGIALSFLLCMFDILPLLASWQSLAISFHADTAVGCWLMVFGAIFALGGFLTAPCLSPGWSDICFLDVACIHQTDEAEMQQGINNIGSFLSASSQLHVLWSGPYLTRLWCIFEIAAYRKLNPTGKIVISTLRRYFAKSTYGRTASALYTGTIGRFRQEVLGIVKPCGFTLPYIFLGTTPINALCLEGFLALCKGGAPAESILSYFVSVVVGNNMLWLPASMVFLDFVSKRIVSPSGGWTGHLQTLMIFLVMSALTVVGAMCAVGAYTGSVWLVFLWIGCAGIFASIVWYRCWHQ
ncbi:HERC1 [Symbiodinium sp. CCMP2456]|nr:HERC1 [Symbiodinium sp. CCMP2456]